MVHLHKCKTLRTPANMLVVNLAVSDCLMLLKMPVFIYNCFYKGPVLGDMACRIYGFLGGLTGTASIGTLAAISFDRYFVIRFPLKRYSGVRIYVCLVFSWVYALFFSIIPLLDIGLGKYQYEGYLTSCSFDYLTDSSAIKAFISVFFCAAFVCPMCIIAFSYFKIVQVIGGRSNVDVSGKRDSFRHVKEEDKRKQEIKLAVVVLIVILLWVFSWLPYATVALLGILGKKHLITPFGSMIPALFCKTTSAIDPYVYAISHPKFKGELWKMLGIRQNKNVKENKKSNRKVWSTDARMFGTASFESTEFFDDHVEEETVEIELAAVSPSDYASRIEGREGDLKTRAREIKRQASNAALLCLNPSFSNKSSSIRRMTRKLSGHSKYQEVEETAN